MALAPRLDLRQSQQLVMTPQLQQAIKLLQYSNVELAEFVDQELERNPLLERDESSDSSIMKDALGQDDDRSDGSASVVESLTDAGEAPLDCDGDMQVDGRFETGDAAFIEPGVALNGQAASWTGDASEGPGYETLADGEKGLKDHLSDQVPLAFYDAAERLMAAALVDALDDAGYLTQPLDDLARGLGADLDHLEIVLETCQTFDPAGVFARDLKECLALQLKEQDRLDPCMETFLENLDLLAAGELSKLKKLCGAHDEDLEDLIADVRALDPKPGLKFDASTDSITLPDVLMTPLPSGGWRVDLNPQALPRVLVNNSYYTTVSQGAASKDDKAYVADQLQSANWLVKALHQRAETIIKVSAEIVKRQDAFFRHGVSHLKPMVLRDVADAIEMHESTVSRVTSNKYILTPRGLLELKYFFSQGLPSASGEEGHAAEAVKHRLKALIEAEASNAILSDDKLVDLLHADGVTIARRTVAKYRESMNIPSSTQRRRQKKLSQQLTPA